MQSVQRLVASGLLISFLFVVTAFSQGAQTGGLTGVITDPAGAVVPNATIKIISENTGNAERTINTDSDGSYSATLLPPGMYRLQISAANFKQSQVTGVQVRLNETARQDVRLEVGNVQERVDIEATPSLINPASAVTGQAIDSATFQRLPLASPNVLFLLSLSTGTAGEPTDVRTNGRGGADINVNGGRTSNNSISLEGINVNDFNLA
ncbi:MAG: hypothetical protein QOD00_1257, partial [Blastocatellia bacterium]|nr:hypothetical protein [Blastocatellia bacterium]